MHAEGNGSPPPAAGGTDRLTTLTDGVVAIALTLLFLTLNEPNQATVASQGLGGALWEQRSGYLAVIVAFWTVARYWLSHRRLLHHVRRHDDPLARLNFLLLLAICSIPFTANLLGDYDQQPLAVALFSGSVLTASVGFELMVRLAHRRDLLHGVAGDGDGAGSTGEGADLRDDRRSQALIMVLALASLALTTVSATAALLIYLALPLSALGRLRGRAHR